jgi:hypothetical protein
MTEFDDTLTRLFGETRETLPGEAFLESVATRISHARRRRAIKQMAVAAAAAALAVALTPYVVEGSLSFASHLGIWLPVLGNALASPVIWACSLAVAAWAVRRARKV